MSLKERTGKHMKAVIGLGVVAVSPAPDHHRRVVKPVAPATGVPTGVVTFILDGLTGSPVPGTLGTTGRAQFAQVLTAGPHSVKVTYPGDTKFLASTATLSFTA